MKFTDKQLEWIRWGAMVVLIAVFGFLGLQTPSVPSAPSGELVAGSTNQKITSNREGSILNVLSGGQINAAAGSTVVFNGDFQPTVVRVNGTPVFWATPQPTPTVLGQINNSFTVTGTVFAGGVIANSGIYTTSVSIAGTPVVAFATPNISGGLYTVCGSSTITGTGTINHGLATPSYITYGLAQDATGDGVRLSHTNAAKTVTLKAWNSALTPAAATTPVAIDWCATGTK